MGKYRRLASAERYQIEALKRSGLGVSGIARLLGRAKSSISRELRRQGLAKNYCARKAQTLALQRSVRSKSFKIAGKMGELVRSRLALENSPEQISGWLKLQNKHVSHETIYRFIYADRKRGGDLWTRLRRRRRWRRPRGERRPYAGCGKNADRTSIDKRPAVAGSRSRLGDFERDTMKGKDGHFLTIVDRRSKLVRIRCILRNSGMPVHHATVEALKDIEVNTITNDNGKEFCDHVLTAKALKAEIFFSNPYCSWERGTNENTNGLIRQYFSRSTVPTPELAQHIEDRLNNRPRKGLGYRTPNEIHGLKLGSVALAG